MSNHRKPRLFIDIDGTLAEWKHAEFSELVTPGYYAALNPNHAVVEAVRIIISEYSDVVETFSLSACLKEAPFAEGEKNQWLDSRLESLDAGHRVFCLCGTDKSLAVPGGIRATDVLLDDYSYNLRHWKGSAVKLLNGINGTKGTWTGATVSMFLPPRVLAESIVRHCCANN